MSAMRGLPTLQSLSRAALELARRGVFHGVICPSSPQRASRVSDDPPRTPPEDIGRDSQSKLEKRKEIYSL